jgi:NAD(P)-dependent dehydrogenase (short-subunit alcohol dehydrogenase family)
LDLNAEKLAEGVRDLQVAGTAIGIQCDVTDQAALDAAFDQVIREFGGLDICVVNAGNARRGTVADTTDSDYEFLSDLLMKAYFTTMRRASQVLIDQGTGGSIVVVGSKNGVAVGSNAAIYSAAKSFELHLMRSAANDLAKFGIRCNAVNPDAVLQGSGIWSDAWKEQTAASLGISIEDLPEYYRKRSMLARAVEPDHIAEAVAWLASEQRSSRTTGATIPVDGGVREAFLR